MFIISLDFFKLPRYLFFPFIVCLFASRFRGVQFVLFVIDDLLKHNGNSGVMKEAISQKRTFELPSKIITVNLYSKESPFTLKKILPL